MATKTQTTSAPAVKAIPEGYHTITPSLTVKDAAKAIEFYKKALGATEIMAMPCSESGKIMHAELKVGDSIFFIGDENPAMGCMATTTSFYLYVNDCDASYKRAIDAGATAKYPLNDMFWGDRTGAVADPYGNIWTFATHKIDYTPEQMEIGKKAFAEQMKAKMSGSCSSSSKKSCS